MKVHSIAIAFFMMVFSISASAQEYHNSPGLDKFAGYWRYINGQDTISLLCTVRYTGSDYIQIRGTNFYYDYVQGTSIIRANMVNSPTHNSVDFGGTKPYGPNLDTLEFAGEDRLKNKTDRGYVVINAAGDQLKFVRDLDIDGGGLVYSNGALPGFTLPSGIIFTRYTPPSEELGGRH